MCTSICCTSRHLQDSNSCTIILFKLFNHVHPSSGQEFNSSFKSVNWNNQSSGSPAVFSSHRKPWSMESRLWLAKWEAVFKSSSEFVFAGVACVSEAWNLLGNVLLTSDLKWIVNDAFSLSTLSSQLVCPVVSEVEGDSPLPSYCQCVLRKIHHIIF